MTITWNSHYLSIKPQQRFDIYHQESISPQSVNKASIGFS